MAENFTRMIFYLKVPLLSGQQRFLHVTSTNTGLEGLIMGTCEVPALHVKIRM
jgi:hypothetical protein